MKFADLPEKYSSPETARIAVIPVPYGRPGLDSANPADGPEAIINASAELRLFDIETRSQVYRDGIFTAKAPEIPAMAENMVDVVKNELLNLLRQRKFTVMLGGEHTVSIAAVEAHYQMQPSIGVLQLGSHCEMNLKAGSSMYGRSCTMARIREMCPVVQMGIRSMQPEEKDFVDPYTVYFARDMHKSKDWLKTSVRQLPHNVYITVDVSVFDPSIMPSVTTPEPGGLGWYQVLEFLKRVFEKRNVIGFDVVELCPRKTDRRGDFLAAKLVYKMLSYKFS